MSIHKKLLSIVAPATMALLFCVTASGMLQAQVTTQDEAQPETRAQAPVLPQLQTQMPIYLAATTPTTTLVAGNDPETSAIPASTSDSESKSDSDTAATPAVTPLPDAPGQAAETYTTGNGTPDGWRVGLSIYGWFPSLRGTVGVLGNNASIHVPFSDVFDYLKGVIPINVEFDKGRFIMPIDYIWLKLGDIQALPVNELGQTAVDTHVTESIFSPKVGFRLYNGPHMKIDATAGARYWYLSTALEPLPAAVTYTKSVSWVDGVGGGRFIFPFGDSRAAITIAGDAGGGGANLDYQVAGILNINFNRFLGLGVGYRYLDVNYQPTHNAFIFDTITSGAVAGLYVNFGGPKPVPISASCSAYPAVLYAGEQVTVTATGSGLNPKWNTIYTWNGNGVTGNGPTATISTGTMRPGTYTVSGQVKEGKTGKEGEKPWQVASCSASYTVKPFEPPTVSCSVNPSNINPGDSATVTATAMSPQNRPLTYGYAASSGNVSASGSTGTYSSAGVSPGPVRFTCSVSDDVGHTVTANTSLNIQAPPPPPNLELEVRLKLHSVYFPTAKPDEKNPEGGLVDSQKATLSKLATDFQAFLLVKPDARLTLIGHADPRGTVEYNQKLSERRVGSTKAFLVSQGVPEASLDTKAEGEEQQLSQDDVQNLIQTNHDLTDDQRAQLLSNIKVITLAQNRRVDVRLNGTDVESSLHYPFNAVDSTTLLDLKKPVRKSTNRKK